MVKWQSLSRGMWTHGSALISISVSLIKTQLHCKITDTANARHDMCLLHSFHWYSLHLPVEGSPGWVDLGGWLRTAVVYPVGTISVLTGPDLYQLCVLQLSQTAIILMSTRVMFQLENCHTFHSQIAEHKWHCCIILTHLIVWL